MPLREYICKDCMYEFETLQRSDETHADCPRCESKDTEKLFSAHGGYSMASGPASVRPRQAGSFKNKKKGGE